MASDMHRDVNRLSAARDQLFSGILDYLRGLDAFNGSNPRIFIVYAHDNPLTGCDAHAEIVKRLIEWLMAVGAKLLSDRRPVPDWDPREGEGRAQPAHNIISNQLCLLPHDSEHEISNVEKVIVCGSPLLKEYYHDDFTAGFLEAVEQAYTDGDVGQAQIRNVVQAVGKDTGFHNVLTELAFLRLRYKMSPSSHGIIPLLLGDTDTDYLPLQHADLRVTFNTDKDSQHLDFFKLLKRIYHNQSELIDAYKGCFARGYVSLCNETRLTDKNVAMIIDKEIIRTRREYRTQSLATDRSIQQEINSQSRSFSEQAAINQCLRDLLITDPRDDKRRIQATKGGLLEDCYIWVLDHHNFRQWRDNKDQQLLWVKGDPGKGKTMLLCGIIDQLAPPPNDDTGLLSYFFCQATDERLNTATAVLRGLLYVLLSQDAFLVPYMRKKYDTAGKKLFEDINAWQALSEIFRNILQGITSRKVFLVVDALDECREGLYDLLDLIVETSTYTHVQWLVSSRYELEIGERLQDVAERLSLELNADLVSAAVRSYISHKVNQLAKLKGYSGRTRMEVNEHLASNANDTFLWVALVCQELEKHTSRIGIKKQYESFPPGLDALYDRMMQQVLKSKHAKLCTEVLALVTIIYRPLSIAESKTLIEVDGDLVDDDELLEEVVAFCASFLTIRDGTIYFVHQSAKDFLTKKSSDDVFPHGEQAVHEHIVSKSVEAMSHCLKRDICGLGYPGFLIEDILSNALNPLASIRYACVYWMDHLLEVGRSPHENVYMQTDGLAHEFFKSKGLYWIESLSLLRSMSQGMTSLQRLVQHLEDSQVGSGLLELASDAYRLLQAFRPAIESRPLQAYTSALVFSPTRSLLRELFSHEAPRWVECKTEMAASWSPCEATLEGHTRFVNCVAVSPDGRYIASGSDDCTIKLWDKRTGICKTTFMGHTGGVASVAFSSDSRYLTSSSYDGTVRRWNIQTGAYDVILQRATDTYGAVAFSPDGRYVAVGSGHSSIKVWDAQNGICKATLEGHADSVESVAFSPADGELIVSASRDTSIRLWETQTWKCKATLRGHTKGVLCVAFSPNGQRVASASYDKTIRLWNTASFEREATLRGHKTWVQSVAFSQDGSRLVSASADNTVKVWDAEVGACVGTLVGHRHVVCSAVFTLDGRHIVSASNDRTVKIWTAKPSSHQPVPRDHNQSITSVVLSADGRCAVSASFDQSAKVWDTATGVCTATLRGHTLEVSSVAFSPDEKRMVTASRDETIKIWDVQTCTCEVTLSVGHAIYCVAFSSDGCFLASGTEHALFVWDAQTGAPVAKSPDVKGLINSVAFSADGMHIVTTSLYDGIKVWNAKTYDCQLTLLRSRYGYMSAAFSPDGKHIVSAEWAPGKVCVWDVQMQDCQATYDISIDYGSTVSFDPTGTCIRTDGRVIRLDSTNLSGLPTGPSPLSGEPGDYDISLDRAWVQEQSFPVLWLPGEYRSSRTSITVVDGRSVLVIGSDWCHMHIFHLFPWSSHV